MSESLRTLKVSQAEVGAANSNYDLLIVAVGYEARARHFAQSTLLDVTRRVAIAFPVRRVHSYGSNYEWFSTNGFQVVLLRDEEVERWWRDTVSSLKSRANGIIRVGIDISSFSRLRLAILLLELARSERRETFEVDFFYSHAQFAPPPEQPTVITACGPVLPEFAGWSDSPETPTAAILGLGYEADRAVGILEYLDPGKVWAYLPVGLDRRYDIEAKRSNDRLWDVVPKDAVISYRVDQVFQCFMSLESLVYGASSISRPVLVPFGPKTFTLCCLLVACLHYPKVGVWRVSSGDAEVATEKVPSGPISGLRASFVAHEDATSASYRVTPEM